MYSTLDVASRSLAYKLDGSLEAYFWISAALAFSVTS